MKKKISSLCAIGLALILLPGCGSSQESPAPTSVNQAMLLQKSAQEQTEYPLPETFTGHWVSQEGRLTIDAQAQVVAEQGTALPTATVTPREFTQEDVDNLLKVFLKGEPLYSHIPTKQELRDWLDYINSPEWQSDPDSPERSPEQLAQRRKELNDYYTAEIKKAPEEKLIIHGFYDSDDPTHMSGQATVDGEEYDVDIRNTSEYFTPDAFITMKKFKYGSENENWGDCSKDEAIEKADRLMAALGFDHMALDAVYQNTGDSRKGTWSLFYVPTVNGFPVSGVCEQHGDSTGVTHCQYWTYRCSESGNADSVYWPLEYIWMCVGKDGILSFEWSAPSTEPILRESATALLPFEDIASIANTMLPLVVTGPKSGFSLTETDANSGKETRMDVDITKVSLSLMRIRDKGSMQGTIVPVWDFWGTSDWYDVAPNKWGYDEKGMNYTTQPMLTLNAIDGNVVSRELGY